MNPFDRAAAANKGFGKVGLEDKPSAFVILCSFCTLAVLKKRYGQGQAEGILFPNLPKAPDVACKFIVTYPNNVMKQIFRLLVLFSFFACGDRTQTNNTTFDNTLKVLDTIQHETCSSSVSNPYGFDTAYEISRKHQPFIVTGYLDLDNILDTAILIRHKLTGKDALFVKHGATEKSFLLKNGKDVGTTFNDFNWVEEFSLTKKGTKVWNNVKEGEIVSEDQIPEPNKFILKTDGIFVHVDEASGGGIIYYNNAKYNWVQQD